MGKKSWNPGRKQRSNGQGNEGNQGSVVTGARKGFLVVGSDQPPQMQQENSDPTKAENRSMRAMLKSQCASADSTSQHPDVSAI